MSNICGQSTIQKFFLPFLGLFSSNSSSINNFWGFLTSLISFLANSLKCSIFKLKFYWYLTDWLPYYWGESEICFEHKIALSRLKYYYFDCLKVLANFFFVVPLDIWKMYLNSCSTLAEILINHHQKHLMPLVCASIPIQIHVTF